MSATQPAPGPTATAPGRGPSAAPAAAVARPAAGTPAPAGRGGAPASLAAAPRRFPTPRLLRLLQVGLVLTGLLFTLMAVGSLLDAHHRMGEAVRNTQQLVRVQTIRSELLRADASMSNSFLTGGLEAPEQRARYNASIERAQMLVVECAQAQPADRAALVRLSTEVGRYARTMEQARDNNRQGYPLGQAYLNEAGTQLRTEALPVLDRLVEANTERVQQQTSRDLSVPTVLAGLLVLAMTAYAMWQVAIRFRRILNPGLALAAGLLLTALLTSAVTLGNNHTTTTTVNRESLATVQATARARGHGSNAKVQENLALISRSGGSYEEGWAAASWATRDALRTIPDGTERNRLTKAWDAYSLAHLTIRNHDAAGRWEDARNLATGTGAGTATLTFETFDQQVTQAMDSAGKVATTSLNGQRTGLVIGAVMTLLMSLAAIGLGVHGLQRRLKEYA